MNESKDVKRVIVTGHRNWDDFETIVEALDELERESVGPVCIVHGGAMGADSSFAELAIANNAHLDWTVEVHRPDYDKYPSKTAPLIRNTDMVKLGAELCIAFYDGRRGGGTVDTMRKAEKAGIRVRPWRPGDAERLSKDRKENARTPG